MHMEHFEYYSIQICNIHTRVDFNIRKFLFAIHVKAVTRKKWHQAVFPFRQ